MPYIKHIGLFTIALLLFLTLAACGGGGEADRSPRDGAIDHSILETYVYLAEFIPLAHTSELIQGAVVRDGWIYFYYVELEDGPDAQISPTSTILVERMRPDGQNLSPIAKIPEAGTFVDIAALRFTADGTLGLLFTDTRLLERGSTVTLHYLSYNPQNGEIVTRNLDGIIPPDSQRFHIDKALFTEEGNLMILATVNQFSAVYLLDENFVLRGQMETPATGIAAQLRDGRVVVYRETHAGPAQSILQVVDFAAWDWGGAIPFSPQNISRLHPARAGDPFDLYIDNERYLFGYNIATGDQHMVLNWREAGGIGTLRSQAYFLDDGSLALFTMTAREGFRWDTEFLHLTPTPRADLPDYEIITLGGFYIPRCTMDQIAAFNRNNQTIQIQVKDYFLDYSSYDDFDTGWQRFLLDILTGRGPDIILGGAHDLDTLADSGMLIDLYPRIDADPDLCRSDFFPNILRGLELPDGSLPIVSNSFHIQTMIGLADAVGHIESWTFAEMAALIEEAEDRHVAFLFGDWMTSVRFLDTAVQLSGEDFIDWSENRSNLDNEAFIQLLEVSARLPNDIDPAIQAAWDARDPRNPDTAPPCVLTRMLRGEQLLELAFILSTRDFRMYRGAFGEDMVALGMPTEAGGAHGFMLGGGFAISAASVHQDAAWEFVRLKLLPDADTGWNFPLRIDLFEAMIAEDMIPFMSIDEDGNEVEVSQGASGMGNIMIDIYALTEAEAESLRAMVESATLGRRYEDTVMEMIRAETLPFFAGDRSAEDTARILQNRVQIFLAERG